MMINESTIDNMFMLAPISTQAERHDMATRTAPAVDGSPTYKQVSVTLIDESGDIRSVSLRTPASATDAQVQSYVSELQSATNASIFRVEVQYVYEGAMNRANATNATHPSVYDNVAVGFKSITTGNNQTAYIPAPLDALTLVGDSVNTTNADYVDWRDAVDTLIGGDYAPRYARFTERRESNERKPA